MSSFCLRQKFWQTCKVINYIRISTYFTSIGLKMLSLTLRLYTVQFPKRETCLIPLLLGLSPLNCTACLSYNGKKMSSEFKKLYFTCTLLLLCSIRLWEEDRTEVGLSSFPPVLQTHSYQNVWLSTTKCTLKTSFKGRQETELISPVPEEKGKGWHRKELLASYSCKTLNRFIGTPNISSRLG